ncbi:MAG: NAD(P)H-hydrate dehydratase [Nitrospirae bacterium]|nr:NAD(P)H-hydrate dehydratase [Nitrospirota bacterium]
MKIITAAQMQALDRRAMTEARIPSLTLMDRAGAGVVEAMAQAFGPLRGKTVTVFCGKGNNGGDGLVVARLLKRQRVRVQVLLMTKATDLAGDATIMYRRFTKAAGAATLHNAPSSEQTRTLLGKSHLIVDALLGTGLSASVTGPYRTAIEAINASDLPVIAVDLPSGIRADTGAVMGTAVRAALTVTVALPKLGLYVGPGIDHAGDIRIVDIGIPRSFANEVPSRITLMTIEDVRRLIPRRTPSSHKGTYGHAGIIAGSVGKTGAAALAAKAALRIGAGLVTVATPSSVNDTLEAKLLEAMTAPMPETKARTLARSGLDRLLTFINARSAVAIGPGLTTHPETVDLLQTLIPRLEKPAVLDADALNALAGHTALLAECKTQPILTPHPGEMARLDEDATTQSINEDRIGVATRFAKRRGVILVLKGARTVVAHPDGRVTICPTGNPGMATAGTGDALTGIIVGLLAQRLSPWDAAFVGTYLHGLAGDLAAAAVGPAGMTAGDLIERIPSAISLTVASPMAV